MGVVKPFCMAADGSSIYAVSLAYLRGSSRDPFLLLAQSTSLSYSSPTSSEPNSRDRLSSTWNFVGSYSTSGSLRRDVSWHTFSCSVRAERPSQGGSQGAFLFTLHAKVKEEYNIPVTSAKWATQTGTGTSDPQKDRIPKTWVLHLGPGGAATIEDDVDGARQNVTLEQPAIKPWSPDLPGTIHSVDTVTTAENVVQGGWVRAYGANYGPGKNLVHFSTNKAASSQYSGGPFPGRPQSSWTIAQDSTIAIAMDDMALYTFGIQSARNSSDTNATCLGLNVLPIPVQQGRLNFTTAPEASKVKSVCLEKPSVINTLQHASMATYGGDVFAMKFGTVNNSLAVSFYYYNSNSNSSNKSSTIDRPYPNSYSPTSWYISTRFTNTIPRRDSDYPDLLPITPLFSDRNSSSVADWAFNNSDSASIQTFLTGIPGQEMIKINLDGNGNIQAFPYEMRVSDLFNFEPFDVPYQGREKGGETMGMILKGFLGFLVVASVLGVFIILRRSYFNTIQADAHIGQHARRDENVDGEGPGVLTYREQESDMQDGEMLPMYTYKVPDNHTKATPEDLAAILAESEEMNRGQLQLASGSGSRSASGSGSGSPSPSLLTSTPTTIVDMNPEARASNMAAAAAASERELRELGVRRYSQSDLEPPLSPSSPPRTLVRAVPSPLYTEAVAAPSDVRPPAFSNTQ